MSPRDKSKIVYVDAMILHRDKGPEIPKKAFVGYFVDGGGRSAAKEVDATQSFEAEVQAVLFAIGQLKGEFPSMRIICDFQSVVSEAKRKDSKNRSDSLQELRTILIESKRSIRLVVLKANPAHKVVTDYVNMLKAEGLIT